ncbi:hypothetical protein BOC43_03990 [Burkholderia pseudomallei]|nr:hypothetical protein BOC43_03990 [Burkholderia pseudomallei]
MCFLVMGRLYRNVQTARANAAAKFAARAARPGRPRATPRPRGTAVERTRTSSRGGACLERRTKRAWRTHRPSVRNTK